MMTKGADKPKFNTWAWNRKYWKQCFAFAAILGIAHGCLNDDSAKNYVSSSKVELSSKQKAVILAGLYLNAKNQLDNPESSIDFTAYGFPSSVNALTLAKAYEANEVSADTKYKGKMLAVVGNVTSIDKDISDNVIVGLEAKNMFMDVRAYLADSQASVAAELQKGEKIRVICKGDGLLIGSPILKNCKFGSTFFKEVATEYANDYLAGNRPNDLAGTVTVAIALLAASDLPEKTKCEQNTIRDECFDEIKKHKQKEYSFPQVLKVVEGLHKSGIVSDALLKQFSQQAEPVS